MPCSRHLLSVHISLPALTSSHILLCSKLTWQTFGLSFWNMTILTILFSHPAIDARNYICKPYASHISLPWFLANSWHTNGTAAAQTQDWRLIVCSSNFWFWSVVFPKFSFKPFPSIQNWLNKLSSTARMSRFVDTTLLHHADTLPQIIPVMAADRIIFTCIQIILNNTPTPINSAAVTCSVQQLVSLQSCHWRHRRGLLHRQVSNVFRCVKPETIVQVPFKSTYLPHFLIHFDACWHFLDFGGWSESEGLPKPPLLAAAAPNKPPLLLAPQEQFWLFSLAWGCA